MDLKKMIQKEHSRAQTSAIAAYIGNNPARFKALVELYLKGPYKMSQRAAWPLSICVEREPGLIKPHLKSIIAFLKKKDNHDAVKRNTMRLLQFIDIPKQYHGQLVSLCFEYVQNSKVAVAIRVSSMTVLSNIISGQPDLVKELTIILEDQIPYGSPAFVSRARSVLRKYSALISLKDQ
jgi:hypothetical protein